MKLSDDPQVMQRFMDYLAKDIVRDEATKRMVLLTGLSAAREPINLFLKGPSSIGKSFNVTNTLRFFGKDVWWLGGLSPTALVHDYGIMVDPETGEEVPDDWRDKRLEELLEEVKLDKAELSPEEKRKAAELKKKVQREYREVMKRSFYLVDLSGRILVFLDAPHLLTYQALRPILSHDRQEVVFKFTDKVGRGTLRTKTVVLRGWPAAIFCTSDPKYIEDLSTRGFSLTPEMSQEKYRDANILAGTKKAFPRQLDKELPAFAEYIGQLKAFLLQGTEVLIPYGPELGEIYPHTIARDMRDLPHFLALIEMFTVFHTFLVPTPKDLVQRPVLELNGEKKAILATMQDFVEVHKLLMSFGETTRSGLPGHILKVFHDVMLPLSKEMPDGFRYGDLVKKHNEVFSENMKSSGTMYDYVKELRAIGYVDTQPDPLAPRFKLIQVLKNPPDVLLGLVGTLANSFRLENLKKWWNALLQRCQSGTTLHITNFDDLEDLYKKCYVIEGPDGQRPEAKLSPEQASLAERGEQTFRLDQPERPQPSFKSIVALDEPDFGECCICKKLGVLCWQVETFQGEWGLACQDCGTPLLEKVKAKGEN